MEIINDSTERKNEKKFIYTGLETEISLKYRAAKYDQYDKTYADELRTYFYRLSPEVKTKFNLLTKNLMNDEEINRYCLLNAIDDFVKRYNSPNEPFHDIDDVLEKTYIYNVDWLAFTDQAFNYRPYQPCIVM